MKSINLRFITLLISVTWIKCIKGQIGDLKKGSFSNSGDVENEAVFGVSCNFDSDSCAWTDDDEAEFTWTRNNGSTPSYFTGPPWDHTTKNANQGSYLFIETSSPRKMGDKARIISSTLSVPGTYCLTFWHHMHGRAVQNLNVYIREKVSRRSNTLVHFTGPWSTQDALRLRSFDAVWNYWNQQFTEFTIATPSQLIFEGIRGKNFQGDIAIDDILLKRGPCHIRTIDCDFQNNTCGWSQMSRDEFNWMPNSERTNTKQTGPLADHTFENADGRYLFIESSWPRTTGDRARLISPPLRCVESANPMLRFWYHMHGTSIGHLRVYLVRNEMATLGNAIWQVTGEQGDTWTEAVIAILPNHHQNKQKFHIIIEGERLNYQGDAAIDDILLTGCWSQSEPVLNAASSTTASMELTSTESTNTAISISEHLTCNFDHESLCGWSIDAFGDFNWALHRGSTDSLHTGPYHDHTNTDGWYIYAEGSKPQGPGDRAIVRSSAILPYTRICLRFYYLMYGEGMGSLEVLTARAGESLRFGSKVYWHREGEQSENETQWIFGEVDLSEPYDYDIAFRAIIGANWYSDIALDDISVELGNCYNDSNLESSGISPTLSQTATPFINPFDQLTCTFDSLNTCNWIQLDDDELDFTISTSGSTPTRLTGPSQDRTGGGEFAFIEASPPHEENDTARLLSTSFPLSAFACFSMWYHMYGSETGSLAVYQSNENNTMREKLWEATGERGNKWRHLQLNLVGYGDTSLIIEAVRGRGPRSDIAIDDISLKEGECPILNCTFQTGLCGWTQEAANDQFNWTRARGETSTSETGPEYDHTYKNRTGHYVYIETSKPRKPGDKAKLISPVVQTDFHSKNCLQFWFHSYGRHVESLKVYKRHIDSRFSYLGPPIWLNADDEGNRWVLAKVTIEDGFPYQVIFEGETGQGIFGDIAIDDVTISPGRCRTCCGDDVFRCGNNVCISASLRCNGVEDCEDGSDESFCGGVCGRTNVEPSLLNFGGLIEIENNQIDPVPLNQAQTSLEIHSIANISMEEFAQIRLPNFKRILTDADGNIVEELNSREISSEPRMREVEEGLASQDLSVFLQYRKIETIRTRRKRQAGFLDFLETYKPVDPSSEDYSESLTERTTDFNLRIVGGHNAIRSSWPWQGVYYITSTRTKAHYMCGATLIAPYWAITAAHCSLLGDVHHIVLGDHYRKGKEGSEQEMKVEAIYLRQDYNMRGNYAGDIALIKFKYPARTTHDVQPACLLDENDPPFEPGSVCAISGWGSLKPHEIQLAQFLQQGEARIVSREMCQTYFELNIENTTVCAGRNQSNTCRGDSGGPLVCKRGNTAYLVGITSWGDLHCDGNIPGVYTQVQSYLNWIRTIMAIVDECQFPK